MYLVVDDLANLLLCIWLVKRGESKLSNNIAKYDEIVVVLHILIHSMKEIHLWFNQHMHSGIKSENYFAQTIIWDKPRAQSFILL